MPKPLQLTKPNGYKSTQSSSYILINRPLVQEEEQVIS